MLDEQPRINPSNDEEYDNEQDNLGFMFDTSIIEMLIKNLLNGSAIQRQNLLDNKISERIDKISKDYDAKINKMLNGLILNVDLETYSIDNLSKLVKSVMKVTKSLSNSLTSIVIGLEDVK